LALGSLGYFALCSDVRLGNFGGRYGRRTHLTLFIVNRCLSLAPNIPALVLRGSHRLPKDGKPVHEYGAHCSEYLPVSSRVLGHGHLPGCDKNHCTRVAKLGISDRTVTFPARQLPSEGGRWKQNRAGDPSGALAPALRRSAKPAIGRSLLSAAVAGATAAAIVTAALTYTFGVSSVALNGSCWAHRRACRRCLATRIWRGLRLCSGCTGRHGCSLSITGSRYPCCQYEC
jgi:hypothetical protein